MDLDFNPDLDEDDSNHLDYSRDSSDEERDGEIEPPLGSFVPDFGPDHPDSDQNEDAFPSSSSFDIIGTPGLSELGESTRLKQRDTAKWLEIKLGSLEDLWKSRAASSLLTQDLLENLDSCFLDLQPTVKLRLLLGIFHLSQRNVEQWKEQIENLLSLATQDTDDWVQTVAELMRDFCSTQGFSLSNDTTSGSQFAKTLAELRTCVRKHAKEGNVHLLPLEAAYYSRAITKPLLDSTTQAAKMFNPKRRPKSATVKADLLQKSHDVANQAKTKSGGSLSSVVPIRSRNMARNMDNNAPMRAIPTQNAVKTSGGFSSTVKTFSRPSLPLKRPGGVKLIEIGETPQAMKKRRKEMEVEEKELRKREREEQRLRIVEEKEARKKEMAAAAAARQEEKLKLKAEKAKAQKGTEPKDSTPAPTEPEKAPSPQAATQETPQYAVGLMDEERRIESPPQRPPPRTLNSPHSIRVSSNFPGITIRSSTAGPQTPSILSPGPQSQFIGPGTVIVQRPRNTAPSTATLRPIYSSQTTMATTQSVPQRPIQAQSQPTVTQPSMGLFSSTLGTPSGGSTFTPAQSIPSGSQANPPGPAQIQAPKQYTLSKEVMGQAQEMFRTANKLSRPEKALILGFMAGNRVNPVPAMGNVLTVRLSETVEIQQDPSGPKQMRVETFFQMNYNTGEWKRLKKFRPLDEI